MNGPGTSQIDVDHGGAGGIGLFATFSPMGTEVMLNSMARPDLFAKVIE